MNTYSLSEKLKAFFSLIRWKNLLIIAATLSALYLKGTEKSSNDTLFVFLIYLGAVIAVMAAGNVINDIYDYKIDQLNKPTRVIVDRLIGKKSAFIIYLILNIIGICLAQRWLFFAFCLTAIFALWLYSFKLKSLPIIGNLTVALLTFFSIEILSYFTHSDYPILAFAALAFFIQLLREIVKDIEDIKGDKEQGCRTFPVLFGEQKTKILIYIISVLFIGIMLYWQWTLQKHVWSLYVVYYLLAVFIVKMYRANHKSHFSFLSGLLKLIMLIGLSSVIFI